MVVNLKKQKAQKTSVKHNVFTKENNKIALKSNDNKIMQSVGSIETYAYRMSKDLVSAEEEIKQQQHNKTMQKLLTLIML